VQLEQDERSYEASPAAAVVLAMTDATADVVREEGKAEAMDDSLEQACMVAEEQGRKEAEEQARKEVEEQARKDAEEQARKDAVEQARKEAEELASNEAAEQARKEVEEQARKEAEEQAHKEAEEQAHKEAEEHAHNEEQARKDAEEQARKDAAEQARKEAEELASNEAAEQARKVAAEPTPVVQPADEEVGEIDEQQEQQQEQANVKEMWSCPMCTLHNDGQTTRCTACDFSEAGRPIKRGRKAHARTADSFKFGHCSIPPKQAKAKRNAPSLRRPPDTESCMKCKSVAYSSDDPIFFCETCAKGKPGIHLSCAQEAGLAVPLDGDVTQVEFVFQCNACRRLPTKGKKPLIMNAGSRPETITAGPNDSTSSFADVLSKVQTAIKAPGLLPNVSQPNLRIFLNVSERKLKYLVRTEANEETAKQTVADALYILTFAAAPVNPDSTHQVLTTMAHASPGVSRDMQFLHSQYAKIGHGKDRSWITNENRKAGRRYITERGALRMEHIPFIARNLMIHSILTSRVRAPQGQGQWRPHTGAPA
jgi:chemotaxis protein histidine kinase CheA